MNTTTRLFAAVAISLTASGAAFAQEATYEYPQVTSSQTSRADVHAGAVQARADGSFQISEAHVGVQPVFAAQHSRAEVHAQALAALASGEIHALTAEPSGFAPTLRRTVTANLVAAR